MDTTKYTETLDTTKYTETLDTLKARHRQAVEKVHADKDLTEDAKRRRISELEREYAPAFEEESGRVLKDLDVKIESQYRKAYGQSNKSRATGGGLAAQEETARELRLARIREEVRDDLDGGLDALMSYKEAIRLQDRERADVIARMGPRYLQGARKQRLAELVEENLPEARREGRREHERLQAQRRNLEIGFALQKRGPGGRL